MDIWVLLELHRPFPKKKKYKTAKWLSEEALQVAEKRRELNHKESWVLKNSCLWTVVLDKTLESPLEIKEIKIVNPKGNQSWLFIGRTDDKAETPIPWPPDAKSWLIGKDPDAGKDWRQKEERATEDEMAGQHHWLNGHELEQTLQDSGGQKDLACCSPPGRKKPDVT